MFAITKEFESAAKAVASVKITARNKKVALPSDLDYSLLVKSTGRAFVVDNDALNVAAGWVQAAAPEVAQAAVAVAAKGSLAASMLDMFKQDAAKHNAEDKALAKATGSKAVSAVQNGARRVLVRGRGGVVAAWTRRHQCQPQQRGGHLGRWGIRASRLVTWPRQPCRNGLHMHA